MRVDVRKALRLGKELVLPRIYDDAVEPIPKVALDELKAGTGLVVEVKPFVRATEEVTSSAVESRYVATKTAPTVLTDQRVERKRRKKRYDV